MLPALLDNEPNDEGERVVLTVATVQLLETKEITP